jgi:hypothetical protein
MVDTQDLVDVFDLEAASLDAEVRRQPLLVPLFTSEFGGVDLDGLRLAYLRLIKMHADYVQYTVPALRAAGLALRDGDEEDRRWSELFLGYATGETDTEKDYGHHIWARDDMLALDAPTSMLDAPAHPYAVHYGAYFVQQATGHPYAILGAKGVLEHLSVIVSDDVSRGLRASGIPNADKATRFFDEHGVLDIEHVREGDRNLAALRDQDKRYQVLQGAHVASGTYRALVHHVVPAT